MLALVTALGGCRSNKTCDADAVHDLAQRLDAVDPRERPDLVASGLPKACRLSAFDGYFALFGPNTKSILSLSAEDQAARIEALNRACPQAPGIADTIAKLGPEQRMSTLYDRCDFARYRVLDRDQFLRSAHDPVPWALHQIMLDSGVDEASARSVTQAMFTLERKHFEHDRLLEVGVELPRARATLLARPEGTRAELTVDALRVDEREVVSSSGLDLSDEDLRRNLIASLRAALEDSKAGSAPHLLIYADTLGSAEVVTEIVHVAARLEYQSTALIVETGVFEYAALPIAFAPTEPPPALRVVIDEAGALELIVPERERIDLEQLAATAATFCTKAPESRFALIEPRAGVSVARLVEVALTLRGCFVTLGLADAT